MHRNKLLVKMPMVLVTCQKVTYISMPPPKGEEENDLKIDEHKENTGNDGTASGNLLKSDVHLVPPPKGEEENVLTVDAHKENTGNAGTAVCNLPKSDMHVVPPAEGVIPSAEGKLESKDEDGNKTKLEHTLGENDGQKSNTSTEGAGQGKQGDILKLNVSFEDHRYF